MCSGQYGSRAGPSTSHLQWPIALVRAPEQPRHSIHLPPSAPVRLARPSTAAAPLAAAASPGPAAAAAGRRAGEPSRPSVQRGRVEQVPRQLQTRVGAAAEQQRARRRRQRSAARRRSLPAVRADVVGPVALFPTPSVRSTCTRFRLGASTPIATAMTCRCLSWRARWDVTWRCSQRRPRCRCQQKRVVQPRSDAHHKPSGRQRSIEVHASGKRREGGVGGRRQAQLALGVAASRPYGAVVCGGAQAMEGRPSEAAAQLKCWPWLWTSQ